MSGFSRPRHFGKTPAVETEAQDCFRRFDFDRRYVITRDRADKLT